MYRLNFDIDTFLELYWQKQPTVLRQGFDGFVDPLTPDELAGLALEEQVESRLVSCHGGDWQVSFGPFEDYSEQGEQDWSLLVQAVDHWHPDAARLLSCFRFIPNWRIDDLMVSFSAPGGGVGPHTDQYDVFIIQGQGQRRWRVGRRASLKTVQPHPKLLQVEAFEPIIDAELEPGDILYIPPGFPHEGMALAPSLNYSVGFRAPDQGELLSAFADFWLAEQPPGRRFADPDHHRSDQPGRLTGTDLAKLRALLHASLQDEALLKQFFGRSLSESKHELDLAPADPPWRQAEIVTALQQGQTLTRLEGLRCLYMDEQPDLLYLNGECHSLPADLVRQLANREKLDWKDLSPSLKQYILPPELVELINLGYWYLD